MKALLLPVLALLAASARADIHVVFANRLIAAGVDAPVTSIICFTGTTAPLGMGLVQGPWWLAQLYAWVPGDRDFRPAGQPVPFRSGLLAGSIQPHVVRIPAPGVGGQATVQMVAWCRIFGETYEEAARHGLGGYGVSQAINIFDSGYIATPPPLIGLQSFSIPGPISFCLPLGDTAPAALAPPRFQDGAWVQGFTGLRAPWELVIETSTNLVHWQPYLRPWLVRGQTEFFFAPPTDGPARFFRGWQH